MKEINIQTVERVDDVMSVTVAVMDGKTEMFGRTLRARSKAELDGTLGNLLSEVNRIPDEIAKVTIGKWTPPAPAAPVVASKPTAEEVRASEISSKEMELQALVEETKKKREMTELAATDTEVASKLAEIEALKTRR